MLETKLKHIIGDQVIAILSLQTQLETQSAAIDVLKAENEALKEKTRDRKEMKPVVTDGID